MFQVKRPKYDELKDTLKLLLVFREEFSDIYPEADITRVAITIQKHFDDGFICNAYEDNAIIGSIGAMESEWWFSSEKFLAETWFYILPKYRNFKTARALLKKLKEYANTRDLTIQLPISSGNDTPALYKRLGFKDMGNIWRYK
jgi:GNAT superfamily N-acetyltransferase|tara:strand:+ start:1306 stop:1737 length:432 start_codon:yes stop_codon:yes gene_type:complete